MKMLTLIRHAKSDWTDPDLDDFERPLNPRGKKAAPQMGARIFQRGAIPELIVASKAKRAKKTAQLIAQELDIDPATIILKKKLYAVRLDDLVQEVRLLPDLNHIALVGHNPELSELAQWLCTDSPEWLPTCAVLTLELNIGQWPEISPECAKLVEYDYPKKRTDI